MFLYSPALYVMSFQETTKPMDHTNRLPWLSERLRSVATVHSPTLGRTGTGFVVSSNGHLLTAAHCVVGGSAVPADEDHDSESTTTVAFNNGDTVRAELVGFDMHADVAVLRLPLGFRPPPIPVRLHTYPQPGDTCIVIGNIFGQDPRSVAVGAVRNGRWKDPRGLSLLSTVLTDVATGSGTSGGPILDAAGYVVALHTAAYGGHEGAESPDGATTQLGGGVASPMLHQIVSAIRAASATGPTPAVPDRYVLPCDTRPTTGVLSPPLAGRSGCRVLEDHHPFEQGDVIYRVQGQVVGPGMGDATPADVTWLRGPGTCRVDVRRAGREDIRLPEVGLVRVGPALDQARGAVQSTISVEKERYIGSGYTLLPYDGGEFRLTPVPRGAPEGKTCYRNDRRIYFKANDGVPQFVEAKSEMEVTWYLDRDTLVAAFITCYLASVNRLYNGLAFNYKRDFVGVSVENGSFKGIHHNFQKLAKGKAVHEMYTQKSRLVVKDPDNGYTRSFFITLKDLFAVYGEAEVHYWYICTDDARWVFHSSWFENEASLRAYMATSSFNSFQFDSTNGEYHTDDQPIPPTFVFDPKDWAKDTEWTDDNVTFTKRFLPKITVTRGSATSTVRCLFTEGVSIPGVASMEAVATTILADTPIKVIGELDNYSLDRWLGKRDNLWYVRTSKGSYVLPSEEPMEVGEVEILLREAGYQEV